MVCLPEFKGGRAELCQIEKINDAGAGTIYYARLPDGYLLDCGASGGSAARAQAIVDLVNVVMRWEGQWPPTGVMESIVENNIISALRWRASQGHPYPDLSSAVPSDQRGTE